jgi:tRNA threonylcarbamoyladenosine modification (KEOPS) complex  Pcc1 subunit
LESNSEPQYANVMERSTAHFTRNGDALPVARSGSAAWRQGYGIVLSATTRSHQGPMTLNSRSYKARITVSTRSSHIAASVCHALAPDLQLMPTTDCISELFLENSSVIFKIETSDIASLRANINSYLRLTDASYKCLTL